MKINYKKILNKNIMNVFIEVLKNIQKDGLVDGHHLYITINTKHKDLKLPNWIKSRYPNEITIVIQYEYSDLIVEKKFFSINLSFENIKTNLIVPYDSILSFADPYANFGLKFDNNLKKINTDDKLTNDKSNIIHFNKFKKN